MIQHNEFEAWLEKEQPNVYRAAIGLGWWSPEQRNEATKKMHALRLAWGASRAAALEEAAQVCDQLWTRAGDADQCADAIRAVAKGENE